MITNDTKLNTRAGSAVVRAILWALAGALVMLFLVMDPLGVSPVDGWLGMERTSEIGHGDGIRLRPGGYAGTSGHEDGLWTCGMHPQVLEEEPGQCPICGMNLVPLRQDEGEGDGDGHGHGLWTCPMHPEVLEEEPGSCPICGMDLVEVKEDVANGEREILFYRNPMDPTITSPVPRKDNMGMDYVPVYADEAHSAATDGAVVTINPAVQQNMNVITERVTRRDISHRIRSKSTPLSWCRPSRSCCRRCATRPASVPHRRRPGGVPRRCSRRHGSASHTGISRQNRCRGSRQPARSSAPCRWSHLRAAWS